MITIIKHTLEIRCPHGNSTRVHWVHSTTRSPLGLEARSFAARNNHTWNSSFEFRPLLYWRPDLKLGYCVRFLLLRITNFHS